MFDRTADQHEIRIGMMLDRMTSQASWGMSDEDRAAIQWLKDLALAERDKAYQMRQESIESMKEVIQIRERVEAVIVPLLKAVQSC